MLKTVSALLFLSAALTGVAPAQSRRPGWGALPFHDSSGSGVTFRVWAPNATSVYVPGQFNGWSTGANPLSKELTNGTWTGVWSADVSTAAAGQQYKFYINYNGSGFWKQDPRARLVTASGSGGNSIIYDPAAFNWKSDSFTPPALNNLFVYELHIGTFYTNGNANKFLAATNRLDYLKGLGVNAVELMPVAEFPGNNSWGYNPAQLFAVENQGYGGPDGLKAFVQACHLRGLAVLLDVVHNHYGPGDLEMWNFDGWTGTGPLGGGIYFNQSDTNFQMTPYGNTRPNFNSPQVCAFVQDTFSLWLNEYHVDGFRWDTPNLMMYANNGAYIAAAGTLIGAINTMLHTNVGKISISEDVYNAYGFDSAWDTSYPGTVTPVLTTSSDSNRDMNVIANAVQYNVRYGGNAGPRRVAFLESHDVVGDLNGGVRLVTAIDSNTPDSYWARKRSTLGAAVTLTAPGIPMIFQGQEMLENQAFDSSLPVDWSKTNTYSRIVEFYRDLINLRRDLKGYTPGLKGDQCGVLQVDNSNKLIAFHRWNSSVPSQDAVVVANFANAVRSGYSVAFPFAGTWYAHLNSDSTNYSTDYGNAGSTVVTASGSPPRANITIGPYSALVFSPTPDAPPQLSIAPVNGAVHIFWPSSYSEWALDKSTGSGGVFNWAQVPGSQYQTNGTTISVTLTPGATPTFYRLHK